MASLDELVCPRPCTEKPKFTVGDLRRAIPAHCFERSAWKSSQYLLADLLAVTALVYFSTFIDRMPVPFLVRAAMWGLYWFFQGAVCTGGSQQQCTAAVASESASASAVVTPSQHSSVRHRVARSSVPYTL
jgi:hypothetical protein